MHGFNFHMAPQKKRDNAILNLVFSSAYARMKARKLYMDEALCHNLCHKKIPWHMLEKVSGTKVSVTHSGNPW